MNIADLIRNKIKIESIKNFLKKIPKALAKRPFLTFFGLLILSLAIGGVVFYKYVILTERLEINISKKISKFEESTYQEVINQWQQREERLKGVDSKIYFNPFQEARKEIISPTSTEETTFTPEATSTPPEATSTSEESPPITPPEKINPLSNIDRLLAAKTIFEFYIINNGWVPSVRQRAKVWQEKGLGSENEYQGTAYQNMILLSKLKEELTK